jgi:hypothetical protein
MGFRGQWPRMRGSLRIASPQENRNEMALFKSVALGIAAVLIAGAQHALAQRCPPNSHPEAVAIPGNLRTAQCFCDRGFVRVDGICVRVTRPSEHPAQNNPNSTLVAPMPFR